jgi:hypothetical protein
MQKADTVSRLMAPGVQRWRSEWLRPGPIAIAGGYAILIAAFWTFTADDAFIAARYGENLANEGEFVYNLGDRVTAMTSPFHGLLLAVFELVFGSTTTPNKVLGTLSVLTAGLAGWSALRADRERATIFLGLVLLSPFAAVWAVGGLETPYLLLVVTLLVVFTRDPGSLGPGRTAGLSALVGLAFLIRFDSIVFTGPLLLWLAWRQRRSVLGLLALAPASIALAWLAFSKSYYDAFLPTSFYFKRPDLGSRIGDVVEPAVYELQFLLLTGLALLLVPQLRRIRGPARAVAARWLLHERPWAVAGLAGVAGYGLLAALEHMMFSYRLFVPYLPAVAFLGLELGARLRAGVHASPPFAPSRAARLLIPVAGLQLASALWVFFVGLNPSLVGEYSRESVRNYTGTFMPMLRRQVDEIRADWSRRGQARPPRVLTFVAGIVPHRYPDVYVFEGLVSYRHDCKYNTIVSADYVHSPHAFVPNAAPPGSDIERRLQLISTDTIEFGSEPVRFDLYYLPHPERNRLPRTVHGGCT